MSNNTYELKEPLTPPGPPLPQSKIQLESLQKLPKTINKQSFMNSLCPKLKISKLFY